jgi:hypothetical protein
VFWKCNIVHLKIGGKWNIKTLNIQVSKLQHMFQFDQLGEKLKAKHGFFQFLQLVVVTRYVFYKQPFSIFPF